MLEKLKQRFNTVGTHLRHLVMRRRLVVGMTQGQVCVMVLQGWRDPRIANQYELSVFDASSNEASLQWQPYVQTLQTILNTQQLQNLPCSVVLSEQWVRWAVVPWMAEEMASAGMSAQELVTLVQLSFAQLYTDMHEWVPELGRPHYGYSQLAAAIPKALLDNLRSVLISNQLKLSSCYSAHALAWGRVQRGNDHLLTDQEQLFATLDGQTLTLLGQSKPNETVIRSVQVATQTALPVQVIEREILLRQLDHPKVIVFSLNRLPAILDAPAHWKMIDATNPQARNLQGRNNQTSPSNDLTSVGMSSASALCHLLSPIRRDKPISRLEQWRYGMMLKRVKALDIDFARHNAQSTFSTRAMSTTAVLATVLLLANYAYLDVQVSDIQSQLGDAKRQQIESRVKHGASVGNDRRNIELINAKQIVASLNRPWERLFVAIESATNSNITLLDITPNPQGGDLHVSGDARNFKSVLAFVQALKEQGAVAQELTQVYLNSHQVQEQDPLRTIHFEVNASWRTKDPLLADTGVNSPKAADTDSKVDKLVRADEQQTVVRLEGSR
jgi:hypothetical protein